MSTTQNHWYQKPSTEALEAQKSGFQTGLHPEEVARRRQVFGPNELPEAVRRSGWKIWFSQFADFMVLVLLGAAVIAGLLGEPEDIIAILAIVLLNAVLGFVQEWRAQRAIEGLKTLATPQARVKRLGKVIEIPAYELVPGDLVLIEAGNLIPADLRLIEAIQLKVDESALTGESQSVDKWIEPILIDHLPIADQKNMAFKGTWVTTGRAMGLVIGTGRDTELGRIAQLLSQEVEVKTPLQNRITRFARNLAWVVFILCLVIFGIGAFRGEDLSFMFFTAVSLAVAAIPEALPAVVTVALALGARRMSQRNALIRKLPAVESLGSVTYICTDKTGTLTENKMRTEGFHVSGQFSENIPPSESRSETWLRLLQMMAQNNDAFILDQGGIQGDPTEKALLEAAIQSGLDKSTLDRRLPRVAEIPFSSERAMMTTVHQAGERRWVFTKGAPEKILPLCRDVDRDREQSAVTEMAKKGMRVLAFAQKMISDDLQLNELETIEQDLSFIGLVGLIDPPRVEAKKAIENCRSSGIRVVMITGDHPSTAEAIARRLGIFEDGHDEILSGRELAMLSDQDLAQKMRKVSVFARVAPDQKIRIVQALQSLGEIVAMTGDGVNDAPALRAADVGVSMGKGGTEVAREASHLVLLDDHFATIVAAVREGRRIYDNIRKFIRFALAGNSGEILTLFIAPFLDLPVPLLPIQILWVNLVTDGLPGLALAVEPAEKKLMNRPPRAPKESIFAHGLWQHTVWVGLLTAAVTLSIQAWAYFHGNAHWQSMTFTVLTFVQMGHVLAIRSERESLFTRGIFSNLPLLGAVTITFILQLCTLYVPALNSVFKTEPLTLGELGGCILVSCSVFVGVELEKWLKRRRDRLNQ